MAIFAAQPQLLVQRDLGARRYATQPLCRAQPRLHFSTWLASETFLESAKPRFYRPTRAMRAIPHAWAVAFVALWVESRRRIQIAARRDCGGANGPARIVSAGA